METAKAYLTRKYQELELLGSCLRDRLSLACPRLVRDFVECSFQLPASLRAEYALKNWKATDTAWAHASPGAVGPFGFRYVCQRADRVVRGPSFYEPDGEFMHEEVYTTSGMAAISALLFACRGVIDSAQILILPGSYCETLKLVEGYARQLHIVMLRNGREEAKTVARWSGANPRGSVAA